MFTDRVTLDCIGGSGGNGIVSFRREKFIPKGGPCGGNGGRGGSIIFLADKQLVCLEHLRQTRTLQADHGAAGGSNRRQGKTASDLVVKVPCGTVIKNPQTKNVLFELLNHGEKALVSHGGRGGLGNFLFRSPTHQAPNISTPGSPGGAQAVELELKLIADIGLIGMPNAGKSTLLSALTSARVKTAPYPFTTLYPNLGYLQFEDYSRCCIADIPGIISGAHLNKGLGLEFLRHVERTNTLLFVIDASSETPLEDFEMLLTEVKNYDPEILKKPMLIALNKYDLEEAVSLKALFKEKFGSAVAEISALSGLGIPELLHQIEKLIPKKY